VFGRYVFFWSGQSNAQITGRVARGDKLWPAPVQTTVLLLDLQWHSLREHWGLRNRGDVSPNGVVPQFEQGRLFR
jgi:hypothetical protein